MAQLAGDVLIQTMKLQRVGYLSHAALLPYVAADPSGPGLLLSMELYATADRTLFLLQQRAPVEQACHVSLSTAICMRNIGVWGWGVLFDSSLITLTLTTAHSMAASGFAATCLPSSRPRKALASCCLRASTLPSASTASCMGTWVVCACVGLCVSVAFSAQPDGRGACSLPPANHVAAPRCGALPRTRLMRAWRPSSLRSSLATTLACLAACLFLAVAWPARFSLPASRCVGARCGSKEHACCCMPRFVGQHTHIHTHTHTYTHTHLRCVPLRARRVLQWSC